MIETACSNRDISNDWLNWLVLLSTSVWQTTADDVYQTSCQLTNEMLDHNDFFETILAVCCTLIDTFEKRKENKIKSRSQSTYVRLYACLQMLMHKSELWSWAGSHSFLLYTCEKVIMMIIGLTGMCNSGNKILTSKTIGLIFKAYALMSVFTTHVSNDCLWRSY